MDTRCKIRKLLQYFEDQRKLLENTFPNINNYSNDIITQYNEDYIKITREREACLLELKTEFHEYDINSFNRIFDTHKMLSQGWRLTTFTNPFWFLHVNQQKSIDALDNMINKLYNKNITSQTYCKI